MSGWQPDVLGEGYEQRTLELGPDPDGEGDVAAVLSGRGDAEVLHGTTTGTVGPLHRDRVRLLPARVNDGELAPVPGAHSHMLSGYAVADALMVVPSDCLSPGDAVRYIRV